MKKLIFILMLAAACTKEKSIHEPAAKAKLLGTWKLVKYVEETRTPDNVLIDSYEEPGKTGDSCIFKNDNTLYGYEDTPTGVYEDIYDYTFINDSTICWDGENHVIRKLTNTELYFYQEEMNEHNQKDVVELYLVR